MTCSRSNLRASGWTSLDMKKPVVAVVASFHSGMPCNDRFDEFARIIVKELEMLGAKAMLSFTPVISDGITQGTKAMRYSLPSRDYITDCMEMMYEGYCCDAIITLGGCDKSVPGSIMPIARCNAIGLAFYGGPA